MRVRVKGGARACLCRAGSAPERTAKPRLSGPRSEARNHERSRLSHESSNGCRMQGNRFRFHPLQVAGGRLARARAPAKEKLGNAPHRELRCTEGSRALPFDEYSPCDARRPHVPIRLNSVVVADFSEPWLDGSFLVTCPPNKLVRSRLPFARSWHGLAGMQPIAFAADLSLRPPSSASTLGAVRGWTLPPGLDDGWSGLNDFYRQREA